MARTADDQARIEVLARYSDSIGLHPYTEPETFDSGTGGICGCLTLAAVVIVGVLLIAAYAWTWPR